MTQQDKCPFCGSNYSPNMNGYFNCGTKTEGHGWIRDRHCYESQITRLTGLLRRCWPVVREAARSFPITSYDREKANALLPDLEEFKAVEDEPIMPGPDKEWDSEAQAAIYPCAMCGKLRTKDEGGTVFTVCDNCWDNIRKVNYID